MYSGKISVIISVYNHFNWLRLILDALGMQSDHDFEVIIADDGSNAETVAKIKQYISQHPALKIIHSWHEDKGWRKNMALNQAVRVSSGDYLVFIDGDCIPHPDFVADHRRLARKGVLMGGRRVETSPAVSSMIESWTSLPSDFFAKGRKKILSNLFKDGFSLAFKQLKRTWRFPFIGNNPVGIKKQGILGANFGIYKSDFIDVNGFDERYLDPGTGEDCDIDLRCCNNGMKALKASHYALMFHRCHDRLDWTSQRNADMYREAREQHKTYIPTGINQETAQ